MGKPITKTSRRDTLAGNKYRSASLRQWFLRVIDRTTGRTHNVCVMATDRNDAIDSHNRGRTIPDIVVYTAPA